MFNYYEKLAISLCYSSNRFFKKEIEYDLIIHEWCEYYCETILVRNYETNQLLYDSIDHLIISLAQQNITKCSLYPAQFILNDIDLDNNYFNVSSKNHPLIIFKNNDSYQFALIPVIEKLTSKKLEPIGDPEYFYTHSTQSNSSKNHLFALIQLNENQRNKCHTYDEKITWDILIKKIDIELHKSPFSTYTPIYFKYINNLFSYNHTIEREIPLIIEIDEKKNLGCSLIESFNQLNSNIENFTHPKNDSSEYQNFSDKQCQQFNKFYDMHKQLFIDIICMTANHFDQKFILSESSKSILAQLPLPPKYSSYYLIDENIDEATNDIHINDSNSSDQAPPHVRHQTLHNFIHNIIHCGSYYLNHHLLGLHTL